jgi:hypothetical protein
MIAWSFTWMKRERFTEDKIARNALFVNIEAHREAARTFRLLSDAAEKDFPNRNRVALGCWDGIA